MATAARNFVWVSDPDITEARRLIRPNMHDRDGSFCDFVEAGLRDDSPEMRIAVAAIKRGRELATARDKGEV